MAVYGKIRKPAGMFQVKNGFHERLPKITDGLVSFYPFDNEDGIGVDVRRNKLDYTKWVVGTSGSQPGFTQNGVTAENSIVLSEDPFGNVIPIWEAHAVNGDSGADGGWNTPTFSIDHLRTYRYSVWVRRKVIGNGSFYFGCYGGGNNLLTLAGAVNTNPYFAYGTFSDTEWLLVVGVIWPSTKSDTTRHPDNGRYTRERGKFASVTDFKFASTATVQNHRAYLYYSTNVATVQEFCYPRVDLLDGSEPTIQDLLSGEGNVVRPVEISGCNLTDDGLAIEGRTYNIVPNSEFELEAPPYDQPGFYKPGWDTTLHSDAVCVKNWSTGYLSTVLAPNKGFHARFVKNQLPGMKPNRALLLFENLNEYYSRAQEVLAGREMAVECTCTNTFADMGATVASSYIWLLSFKIFIDEIFESTSFRLAIKLTCGTKISNVFLNFNLYSLQKNAWIDVQAFGTLTVALSDLSLPITLKISNSIGAVSFSAEKYRVWMKEFQLHFTAGSGAVKSQNVRISYLPSRSPLDRKLPSVLKLCSGLESFPFTISFMAELLFGAQSSTGCDGDNPARIYFIAINSLVLYVTRSTSLFTAGKLRVALICRSATYSLIVLTPDGTALTNMTNSWGATPPLPSDQFHVGAINCDVDGVYTRAYAKFQNLGIWNRELSLSEIQSLGVVDNRLPIFSNKPTVGNLVERNNLLAPPLYFGNYLPATGLFGDAYTVYTQANYFATVRKMSGAIGGDEWVFQLYRPPNLTIAANGNTMFGGIRISLPESAKLVGHTYRLRYWIKGRTSPSVATPYICASMGWGSRGIGLPYGAVFSQYDTIPGGYNESYWQEKTATYTISSTRWSKGTWYFDSVAGSDILTRGATSVAWGGALSILQARDTLSDNPNLPAGAYVVAVLSTETIQISAPATTTATNVLTKGDRLFDTALHLALMNQSYGNTGILGTHFLVSDISIEDISNDPTISRISDAETYHVVNASTKYFSYKNNSLISSKTGDGIGEVFAKCGGGLISSSPEAPSTEKALIRTGASEFSYDSLVENMSAVILIWYETSTQIENKLEWQGILTGFEAELENLKNLSLGNQISHWLIFFKDPSLLVSDIRIRDKLQKLGAKNWNFVADHCSWILLGVGDHVVKESFLNWSNSDTGQNITAATLHHYI